MSEKLITKPGILIAGLPTKKATEIADSGTFFVLYGQGGAGKTTLAAAAEDSKFGAPALLIDAEGGADAVNHRSNLDVIEVYKWDDFEKITNALLKGDHGYKTIIIDNLCEFINQDLQRITGSGTDAPEIQEWGKMTRDVLFKVRQYRDMARKQGINVFFLAWDSDEKDDRGVLKKDLAFTPALRKEFPGIVTIIGHIRVLTDPSKRMLDFAPSPRTVSKFRRSATAAANKIPFQVYYGLDNLPMADIINVMKGGAEWPEKKYPAPRQQQG